VRITLVRAFVAGAALLMGLPASASAHALTEQYQAPLPLVAYIAGAALAVAMSFAFVMLRTPRPPGRAVADRPIRKVPAWLRNGLSAIGLIAWGWIIVQGLLGGAGDPLADVGYLFLWIFGWIGVALLSALVGPIWSWLDPFSTLHRLLSYAGRRLNLVGSNPATNPYPARLGIWPAVGGFVVVLWLELVAFVDGGQTLAMVLLAYTLFTLAGMSWFGREAWRAKGEVFSVWFGLLGRLAPYGPVGEPEDGLVERRPFAAGLQSSSWTLAQVTLLALGAGAIIYDGLSQTRPYFELFVRDGVPGLPPTLAHTVLMGAFLAAIVALVLAVGRLVGLRAVGAGVLPVAVGYLAAHYVVALLVDGQLIVRALNDPLAQGHNLMPAQWATFEPTLFVAVSLIWSFQLAAVVGGHIAGAWAGHALIESESGPGRTRLAREVPLAVLMVLLTALTLWSLGQEVIAEDEAGLPAQTATMEPGADQRAVSSAASTVRTRVSPRATSSRNIATPAETEMRIGAPAWSTRASWRT
jgi:hypothetical protein